MCLEGHNLLAGVNPDFPSPALRALHLEFHLILSHPARFHLALMPR
jgi:hypothetical protein